MGSIEYKGSSGGKMCDMIVRFEGRSVKRKAPENLGHHHNRGHCHSSALNLGGDRTGNFSIQERQRKGGGNI